MHAEFMLIKTVIHAHVQYARPLCARNEMNSSQPFLVIKGYHMGSAWFEEAFNKLRGGSFFFEYEHCLRDLAPTRLLQVEEGQHRQVALASAMLTFRHLQQSCGSCTNQPRTTRCRACGVVPPPVGSALHATTAASKVQYPLHFKSQEAPCLATGISFAAVGPAFMEHLIDLRKLMPTLPVLVHVRSNLVKHALSYLRQACHRVSERSPAATLCTQTAILRTRAATPRTQAASLYTFRRAPARRTT